jgi:hypothetical protein
MRDKEIERNEDETAWRNDETEGLEKKRVRTGRWLAETSDFSAKNPNFLVIRF